MCMMVYVAAPRALPLIPWQEEQPGFWAREILPGEERVRQQFTHPYVYYVGAHSGCGCGFRYGQGSIEGDDQFAEEERAEEARARESVRRLSEYLAVAVETGDAELYACWDGDQAAEPEHRATVTPAALGGPAFDFKEKQFLLVKKGCDASE